MAEEVIIHGDFVQFNGTVRCEACQAKNLKCALQQNDEGCMACAGANRDCIFSRTVVVSGPKSKFDWKTLLNRNQIPTGVAARTPASSVAFTPKAPLLETLPNEQSLDQQVKEFGAIDRVLPPPPRQRQSFITSPYKFLAHGTSPPETTDSRLRSGVDPAARQPLGEILSLTEQAREFELAKVNARVGQWLDQCLLGPFGDGYDQEPLEMPATGSSRATEVAENGSPKFSPVMHLTERNEDVVPSEYGGISSIARSGHPSAPLPAHNRKRPDQSPTLEAHPWVDLTVFPTLEKNIAQPVTSNDAIMRFSWRAKATEEASRCAVHGDHVDIRGHQFLRAHTSHSRTSSNLESPVEASNKFANSRSMAFNNFVPSGNLPITRIGTDPQTLGYSPYYPSPPPLLPRHYTTIAPSQPPASTNLEGPVGPAVSQVPPVRQEDLIPLSPRPNRTKTIAKPTHAKLNSRDTPPIAKAKITDPCDSFEQEIHNNSPQLPEFLLKRLTQEQCRRYKRLFGMSSHKLSLLF